jgi:hypothetical protein
MKPYRRATQSTLQRITELSKDDQSSAKGVLKDIIDENDGIKTSVRIFCQEIPSKFVI